MRTVAILYSRFPNAKVIQIILRSSGPTGLSKADIGILMKRRGLVNCNFARGSVVVNSADGVKTRCRSIDSRAIDESVLDHFEVNPDLFVLTVPSKKYCLRINKKEVTGASWQRRCVI